MGYTTYYRQTRDMTDAEFEAFKQDAQALRADLPPTVEAFHERYGETAAGVGRAGLPSVPMRVEPQGRGVPGPDIAGDKAVGFNGAGFDDADHETFWIPKDIAFGAEDWEMKDVKAGDRFHCTKTARKPYDAMVCACLLALKRRAPDAWNISSDGSVEEWQGGYRFAKDVLGVELPLEEIGDFAGDPRGLEKAKTPTPWTAARQERVALDQASLGGESRPKRTPGL